MISLTSYSLISSLTEHKHTRNPRPSRFSWLMIHDSRLNSRINESITSTAEKDRTKDFSKTHRRIFVDNWYPAHFKINILLLSTYARFSKSLICGHLVYVRSIQNGYGPSGYGEPSARPWMILSNVDAFKNSNLVYSLNF